MTQESITKEMTIADIFTKFPQKSQKLAQEMTRRGLHCVGCGASTWETLEAGMLSHGMESTEVESLVTRLNEILAEEQDPNTITVTPRAAAKFQEFAKAEGLEGVALRFGDQPGGCSGYEYILDFSTAPEETDTIFHSGGIEIHIETAALSRLIGSEIDYLDGLQGAGFKISNPNARGSCGCGNSQTY